MARETRSKRGYPLHGDPTRGANLEAPTAPHATEASEGGGKKRRPTGPARFWGASRVRIALVIAFSLSLVAHWFVAPWRLLPPPSGIEFKDNADELSIPIDFIAEAPPPPPPTPPPPLPEPTAPDDPDGPGKRDAGPRAIADAGAKPIRDAEADAEAPHDAGTDASSAEEDGGVALGDAGGGLLGPRDPESMFGLSKVVNAGVQNVVLGVNVAVIRAHPVGSRMGPILQQLRQWREFLKGAQSPVDPIRDTDWILIYGPSLINTDKDAVLVRYNVSDLAVDATIAAIAKSYDKGGDYDAGVPGVKASLAFADNAQRVFLRPQPKLLVIVPPSHAHEAAVTFRRQNPRGPSPSEAMRLIVHEPSRQISIPGLKFSQDITEIRLWIVPRADGSADVFAEGDCTTAAAASDSAEKLTDVLKRQNSLGVRIATRGLLNNANVIADGARLKLHILATPEQLESVLQLVGAAVGANLAPPTNMPSPSPTTRPSE